MPLKVVDLFCGAGGLSQGFRQAGYDVIGGSDIDPDACATYRLNFPDAACINGNIRSPDLHAQAIDLCRNADVVVGGPPCQAFSQVRNHVRLIDDPRNSLYREFVSILSEAQPRAFVMENVPGMDQMGVRDQVEEDLRCDGLYVVRSKVVDAADFGAPQSRKRLVFVGVRADLDTLPPNLEGTGITNALKLGRTQDGDQPRYVVKPTDQDLCHDALLAALQDPADTTAVTVEQAIGDLTFLRAGRRDDQVATTELPPAQTAYQRLMRAQLNGVMKNLTVPRINVDTAMRLSVLPEGGNFRDLPEEYCDRYLTDQRWGPSNGSGKLGRKHFYAYRRLNRQFWAWTLNTKADSAYHFSDERALSVREFARLQSFPDHFVFTVDPRKGDLPGRISGGAAHSKYRQVGNAVPPLLAQVIGSRLAELLIRDGEGDDATVTVRGQHVPGRGTREAVRCA